MFAKWRLVFLSSLMTLLFSVCLAGDFVAFCQSSSDSPLNNPIRFSGYDWDVKTGRHSPGKNNWSSDNCWVDDKGQLHLKLSRIKDRWYSAEISSRDVFGYGVYQFAVIGPVDRLDSNVVLGLFVYSEKGEIDIEFAKWGKRDADAGNFTVAPVTRQFPIALEGLYTFEQIEWAAGRVAFSAHHGHQPEDTKLIAYKEFNLGETGRTIPNPPVKVHMNLWLFKGNAPTDSQEVEVIIKSFHYKPLAGR